MKYNPNPQKGDPVRVRLPSGQVITARYDEPYDIYQKVHYVETKEDLYLASSRTPTKNTTGGSDRVRFVYPLECMK
jgi:hypothetical protein